MAGKAENKEEKKEKEKVEMITAVYKVNLHCQECANEIKKPLMRTQGVHSVEVDMEKFEIKVKGTIDVLKIHKRIEKLSKKNVELISPKVKPKENEMVVAEKKVKEELIFRTISAKVYMHCTKCEQDLKKKLLLHKGIHNVKTDMKAKTITVDGTIEPDKLIAYLRKKLHKHADKVTLISEKREKEEKKEKEKGDPKVEKPDKKKENEGKEKEKEKEKEKASESTKAVVIKEDIKIVEVKTKDSNAPYFIHYVYAPQLFSDENPNACHVM